MQYPIRLVVRTAAASIAVLLSLPVSAEPVAEASGTNEGDVLLVRFGGGQTHTVYRGLFQHTFY